MSERLTQVTVNLVTKAWVALEQVTKREGESKTDAINRAIQLYDFITGQISRGRVVIVRDPSTGEEEGVRLL